MSPYEAHPSKIPEGDQYADLPLYGRYQPTPEDFQPNPQYIRSATADGLRYWETVLDQCTTDNYIYPNPFGGRDVLALGSVIIKSKHLQPETNATVDGDGDESNRDFNISDANEVAALSLVPDTIPTPEVLFSETLRADKVLIQTRIPGVMLNIAWPYLTSSQKASFKEQTRDVIRMLQKVPVPENVRGPGYIVPDFDPVRNRDVSSEECEILFGNHGVGSERGEDDDDDDGRRTLNFMHNDLGTSNIVVDEDRIVGVIDWEHAGWFHWRDVGRVHSRFRGPRREDFVNVEGMSEERLADLVYWGDLYDFEA